jgi:hypothetical protein
VSPEVEHPDIRYVVYPVHRDGTPTGALPRMRHDPDCGHFEWENGEILGTPVLATAEQMRTLRACKSCVERRSNSLAQYRTLRAMLALDEFNVADLEALSGVKESTVRTILRRESRNVERIATGSTGRRGGQPVRWRVRAETREHLRETLRELENSGAGQWLGEPQEAVQVRPTAHVASNVAIRDQPGSARPEAELAGQRMLPMSAAVPAAEQRLRKAALPRQPKVFLCHSSADKSRVRALRRQLLDDGCQTWLDEEDILPGQDWDLEIRRAIRASDIVLVCLSRVSINKVGYLQKEIRSVLDVADEQPEGTIFVIPARLEPCEVPDRLRRWQWVDLFEDTGYPRLLRAVRKPKE